MGEGIPQVKKKKRIRKQNYKQKINGIIACGKKSWLLSGSQYGEFVSGTKPYKWS